VILYLIKIIITLISFNFEEEHAGK